MGAFEDSYEIAVTKLARIERAHAAPPPPPIGRPLPRHIDTGALDRQRDLEKLATIACEENERLERELALTQQMLTHAQEEADRLRRKVSALEEAIADPRAVLGLPPLDESVMIPPPSHRRRGDAIAPFLLLAIVGGVVALIAQPVPSSPWGTLAAVQLSSPSYRAAHAIDLVRRQLVRIFSR
jgi:hypothetical protein